jgi:hypothetical protein
MENTHFISEAANATNVQTGANNGAELQIYATAESAAIVKTTNQRTIKQGFKNPARAAFVNVPNEAWDKLRNSGIPDQYASLLDAVLTSAAKSIIKRTVDNLSGRIPNTINAAWLSADAILEEATNSNSGMMSKAELEQAWSESETRKRIMGSERYQASKEYRVAANAYAELILGLTARTPTYTDKQLDTMIAKLDDSDLDTDFGGFILRRIDAIRNKPAKQTIDLDLL